MGFDLDKVPTTTTEAPTNDATLEAITKTHKAISEDKLDFVTLITTHYDKYGSLVTAELADERYGIEQKVFNDYMSNQRVQEALVEWGIDVNKLLNRAVGTPDTRWRSNSLTPHQLLAARTMLDLVDTRSEKKKLQDLGVTSRTWQAWLRDPVFNDYCRTTAEGMLQGSQHEASLALMDKVRMGDVQALKLYLEYTGRFTAKADSGGAGNVTEVQALITGIIEIVGEEVDDEDTAMRIAERLKLLITARNISSALVGDSESIAIPTTMPARQLSPHMQELMESGRGMND